MNKVVVECRKIGYSAIGMFSILIIIISFLLGSCYMDSDYRSYTVIEMFFLPKRQEVLSNIEMNWLTIWANSINGWVPLILPAALSIGYLFVLSEERESGALRQLLLRENDRSYCISKVIAAMLAGGITLLIANIVYGIICHAAFPSLSCYPAEDVSEYIASQFSEGIPVFVINYIIKTFLYGVLMNIFAVVLSIYMTDKYILICLPMMIHYGWKQFITRGQMVAMERDGNILNQLLSMANPSNILIQKWDKTQVGTIGLMLFMYIIAVFLFVRKMKKGRGQASVA